MNTPGDTGIVNLTARSLVPDGRFDVSKPESSENVRFPFVIFSGDESSSGSRRYLATSTFYFFRRSTAAGGGEASLETKRQLRLRSGEPLRN